MIKTGWAFHIHDRILIEFCTDYDGRVEFIKLHKPQEEQPLRLRLFQLIPNDKLPPALVQAGEAYEQANKAYDQAREVNNQARKAYDQARKPYEQARKSYEQARKSYVQTRKAYDQTRKPYDQASEAYDQAWEAYEQARKASIQAWEFFQSIDRNYTEALETYKPELLKLHQELCPNCPWDGQTIFPDIKEVSK